MFSRTWESWEVDGWREEMSHGASGKDAGQTRRNGKSYWMIKTNTLSSVILTEQWSILHTVHKSVTSHNFQLFAVLRGGLLCQRWNTLNIKCLSWELSSWCLCTTVHLKYIYTVYLFISASVLSFIKLRFPHPVFHWDHNPVLFIDVSCIKGTCLPFP